MKKRSFALGVVTFLVLSSLFLVSLSFVSQIQRAADSSHFVEIMFRSDEPDWYNFTLTVQIADNLKRYDSTGLFTNVEDVDGVGVQLDAEFHHPTLCHLYCKLLSYNVTIQRDLMSDTSEMLYDEGRNSIEWISFRILPSESVIGLSNAIYFFIVVVCPLTMFVSWAIWPRLEKESSFSQYEE